MAEDILAAGMDPVRFFDVCRKAMSVVGERFETGEYFLSDMIMGAEILGEIMQIVKARPKKVTIRPSGSVVIGTVQGDIHDIGKNIVSTVLEAQGFEVLDVGVDVPPKRFVDAAREYKPDIVGMSGLLTLAIESMRSSVDAISAAGLRHKVKVVIGGGRIDEIARNYVGADAFTDNVAKGVELCKGLMAR